MASNTHELESRNKLKDSPDRLGKKRFIVQSVPITLLCCGAKQLNRMFACSSAEVGSTSKARVSVWCALPEPLPGESLVWKCLDTDRIVEPTLYLITEMLLHNSKLALISTGLQAGGWGGGSLLKGHLTTQEKTVSRPLHLWAYASGIGNEGIKGKLQVILAWMGCFFFFFSGRV